MLSTRMRKGYFFVAILMIVLFLVMTIPKLSTSHGSTTRLATNVRDNQSDTWVATDALGRTLPTNSQTGNPRANKTVGMFYPLWEAGADVFDNTRIVAQAQQTGQPPQWGPLYSFHWWGQPYFGYYYRDDEWIIRKHAQMLSDAQVDVIFFDASNGFTYDATFLKLLDVYTKMRANGERTPQVAFFAGDDPVISNNVANHVYDIFYSKNLYSDFWFQWKGKPLILANPQNFNPTLNNFFNLRRSWAWTDPNGWFGDGHDRWPWLANYPQGYGWHDNPSVPEEITVGVAQHPISNIGRSFHNGSEPTNPTPDQGLDFAEQWKRALQVDPEIIFIDGWNEWIAQRFVVTADGPVHAMAGKPLNVGDTYFVDLYNQEYSRDIEPMAGGHGDNYYYQMVDGIRRYKGTRPLPTPTEAKTILANTNFSQWDTVGPDYIDAIGDTGARNYTGSPGRTYNNNSGRNDLAVMRVARDADNIYFYARTTQPLTQPTMSNWMTLYLNTDKNATNGWAGYDYVINRTLKDSQTGILERSVGGWNWQPVANIPLVWTNNLLQFALPRNLVNLSVDQGPLTIDFKWSDNGPTNGDPMGFMDHGDAAPKDRFNFRYQETATTPTTPGPGPGKGTGTGLKGDYYLGLNFNTAKFSRTDATINFNWNNNSPDPSLPTTGYSVRWTGQVQPLYSENYTFNTTSDDGVRLWVNGQQLVNNWSDHAPTVNTGTINLQAGTKYDLKLEFYQNLGGAEAMLAWSSAHQGSEIIPQSQLYQATTGTGPTTVPDPNSGLKGYWSLDEGSGTVTADASGNGNGGVLWGNTAWTTGKSGKALSFTPNGNVDIFHNALVDTAKSYTVGGWVNLNNTTGWQALVGGPEGGQVSGFFLLYSSQLGGNHFSLSVPASDCTCAVVNRATSTTVVNPGTWYYVSGVYDAGGGKLKLYVNGKLEATTSVPAAWTGAGAMRIGRDLWTAPADYLNGTADQIRIYNRALSDAEINTLYNSGK